MDLEQSFASTCKVLFGEEIGKLSDFEGYLGEMMTGYSRKKSFVSGKDVLISLPYYPESARYISQDEMGELKFPPLNVNEIKDIDSLFSAVQERVAYCGNKLFGRNIEVSDVDNCIDCTHVSHAHNVREVKYGAYLSYLRESEYVFGVWGFPGSRMSIRVAEGTGSTRCFESYYSSDISDLYYSINCIGCTDGIFAFNLRSKRNVIGNLELPKDEYSELKKKLLSEISDELRKKKRLFSLADIAFFGRDRGKISEEILYDSPVPPKIESAFGSASKLVLGKERKDIRKYSQWLLKRAMKIWKVRGARGTPTFKLSEIPVVRELPADRLLPLDEAIDSGKTGIEMKKGEKPGLAELLSRASKIAYFTVEFEDGQNENCVDTPALFGGSNIYKSWDTTDGKNSAYTTAIVRSSYLFGGFLRLLDSTFCINCFNITKVSNSFEIDSSYSTRNSYLCHNVENADSCILCFNVKGLRNAVGNTSVSREEFERVKKLLLDYINKELDEKRGTELSIFSIPKPGKKG